MLSAEQIQKNWKIHLKIVDTYFSGIRKEKIQQLYNDFEEIIVLSPASSKDSYHNAFPGGYIDHVNRVIRNSFKVLELWNQLEIPVDVTTEELVFSAMFHDLGKLGTVEYPGYLKQDDDWRRNKLGEIYKVNINNNFMLIQDRSLYTLQKYEIKMNEVEYLTIKTHDGLYDDTNKPYLISYNPDSKLRSNLPYILHQADFMAYKYEYDHWKANKPQ